VKHWQIIT